MKKFTFILLFSMLLTACNEPDVVNTPEDGTQQYVKLSFVDQDGSFEDTKISKVVDLLIARLFADNLTIDGDVTLQEGDYDVVQFKSGTVVITGDVTFKNLNPLNNKGEKIKILILKEGHLTINSSLNQNGDFEVINYGILNTGNHEMQGATWQNARKNIFNNYGSHFVNGDLQISSDNSFYNNCGFTSVSANTNFHQRGYIACECGQLITNGLNVNIHNAIKGKGFIKVTGNLNLNHKLTESAEIEFSYCTADGQPRELKNQEPQNLGAAKRVCQATCTPGSMPIKYSDLKIARYGNKLHISFNILESSDLMGMRVLISPNAKNWKEIYVESPDKLKSDTKYSAEINISEE